MEFILKDIFKSLQISSSLRKQYLHSILTTIDVCHIRLGNNNNNNNNNKSLEDLEVGGRVETIQTTALLKTARILRGVLKT